MIGNSRYGGFQPVNRNMNYAAQELKKYSETADRRSKMGLEGDGAPPESFAALLKRADEFRESGESCGATDSIGIILRQMDEPQAGEKVTKTVFHNGVCVVVEKDYLRGNSITVGGSSNPNWIHVNTSVGTVHIDLNDIDSLMKCLDMFSPEDLNLILRKITEVRQCKDAIQEIDQLRNTEIRSAEDKEEQEKE